MQTLILAPLAAFSVEATAFAATPSPSQVERAALNRQEAETIGKQREASRKQHAQQVSAYNDARRTYQARVSRQRQLVARYQARRETYELKRAAYLAYLVEYQQNQAEARLQPVAPTQSNLATPAHPSFDSGSDVAAPKGNSPTL